MNAIAKFDVDAADEAARIPAAAALPDAPLAMPAQPLEAAGPVAWLRALFGAAGRTVKH